MAVDLAHRPDLSDVKRSGESGALPDEAVFEPDGGFWVFGYGSLMWNPGFEFAERREALLPDYHRSFCLWSVRYRGTPARPGLVVALAEAAGEATRGVAYRVAPEHAATARAYLLKREMVSNAYREKRLSLRLLCGRAEEREALAYVIDPRHAQYAGGLSLRQQAAVIAASEGPMGPNCDYLFNTVAHLRTMGLTDAELGDLAPLEAEVKRLLSEA